MPLEKLSEEVSRDISLAISACRQMEGLLSDLGAVGRGAHGKLDFLEHKLQEDIVKKARFIAAVRNTVLHEHKKMKDRVGFEIAAKKVVEHLEMLIANDLTQKQKRELVEWRERELAEQRKRERIERQERERAEQRERERTERQERERAEQRERELTELQEPSSFAIAAYALFVGCLIVLLLP